jgi:LysR family glycine cleavage system transcriptional activator
MRHNLNLNWLRSFEAAARLLSFTGAAQEIGLTQTAVSQHIKALEAQLDGVLFVRRPKSLQLTDVGKAYLPKVREALDTIEMSTTGLFGPRQSSTIVVRASMAFIIWLTPRLGSFQKKNPNVGVKFVTSIWKGSTDQQPVDVDIVLASRKTVSQSLEKLSDEFIVPVSSQFVGAKIKKPRDIMHLKPIHIMGFDDHWARYFSAFGLKPEPSVGGVVTDTSVAAIEMVSADLGCAVVIERFAQQAIQSGRKISIVGEPIALGQSHFLVRKEPQSVNQPSVEGFEDWLRQQF